MQNESSDKPNPIQESIEKAIEGLTGVIMYFFNLVLAEHRKDDKKNTNCGKRNSKKT